MCEDFERPLGADWEFAPGGCGMQRGTVERDTTRGHGGAASLRSRVEYKDQCSGFGEIRRALALPKPDVFVRMFVYLPAGSIPKGGGNYALSVLSAARGYMAAGVGIGGGRLETTGWGNGSVASAGDASGAFPTDRWVCVEYQLAQGAETTLTAWRDGQMAVDRARVRLSEPLDSLRVGVYGVNLPGNLVDVWIDDVAVAARRIGCASGG